MGAVTLGYAELPSMCVYHTGADTLALTFFFGIRHHADLQGKQRAALGSLSHMETGPIVCTEQLMENCRHLP